MASPTPSRIGFFDLPPEIRNEIYAYALAEDKPIKIGIHRRRSQGILYTCHQSYSEGLPMFYSHNIFQACSPASAKQFLRGLDVILLPAVRCLRVMFELDAMDEQLRYPGAGARYWLNCVQAWLRNVNEWGGYDKVERSAIVMPLIVDDRAHIVWVSLDEVDNFTFRPQEGMERYGLISRKQKTVVLSPDVSGGTR